MPTTPKRNVRIPDELWEAALDEALRRGETVTDAINRSLARYAKVPIVKRRGWDARHTKDAVERRKAST